MVLSIHPLPLLNPACLRSFSSTPSVIQDINILQNTLLGMESKVIPLQLLQLVKSDFVIHLFGVITFSKVVQNTGCKISAARTGSVLKGSVCRLSVRGAFLFFIFFIDI